MDNREKIARIITGEPCKMLDGTDDPLHEMDADKNYEQADQLKEILTGGG